MNRVQRRIITILIVLIALLSVTTIIFLFVIKPNLAPPKLIFDESVNESEQISVENAFKKSEFKLTSDLKISILEKTDLKDLQNFVVLSIKVPVTDFYDYRFDSISMKNIADDSKVSLIDIKDLTVEQRLLALDGNYYLDSFSSGAVFRTAYFSGSDSSDFAKAIENDFQIPGKNETLTLMQTGVTALAREMIYKLNSVGDPKYFSEQIGNFLSDADYTHTSNEVSFMNNCPTSSSMSFCSPMAMLEVLKSSGIDIVELTGNHNNDRGSDYNTETINLYHELGWGTFGGGLNNAEAAKPFKINTKNSNIAMFGYNVPCDAISGTDSAGANCYDYDDMVSDIAAAKANDEFVIIDFQYMECYSYPDGYIEFPECDSPIVGQTELFRSAINAGADMVVGVQAHQPQTFEIYNGKPIFYGLGNLYFDQDEWPGTERSLVLKHYFLNGKYVQTRIFATVYGSEMQTKLMDNAEKLTFIERLLKSRP